MGEKKQNRLMYGVSCLLFFAVLIIHYSSAVDISIKNATPLAILPLIMAFSMFNEVTPSAFAGFATGLFMDGVTGRTLCFNTVFLMLGAVIISVLADNLFNKNIRAALVICILLSAVYYIFKWAIFYTAGSGLTDNLSFLLYFAFPSAVYTEIFVFPFYFIYKYFNSKKKGAY